MARLDPDGWLTFWPQAFPQRDHAALFEVLQRDLDWAEREITMFGRRIKQPRLVAFHGEPGVDYGYSGQTLKAQPWGGALDALRHDIQRLCQAQFNSVLCNLYRDGQDSMGWHADDEASLGPRPLIASYSLGGTRRFCFKSRQGNQRREIQLTDGSLLLMGGDLQHHWLHQLPKTRQPVAPRINLTFRWVYG
ncbi:MAG: alpha-ketoglutarate-dependent dioxygenase AlkB family protein [Wenzhouxiangella sp.]